MIKIFKKTPIKKNVEDSEVVHSKDKTIKIIICNKNKIINKTK